MNIVLMFRDEKDKNSDFMKIFEEASKKYKGKILFSFCDIKAGIQERLGEFMGVTSD